MKKIMMLIMMISFTIVLSGCSFGQKELTNYDEYIRISLLIPDEITKDIVLPKPSEGFTVLYYIDNKKLEEPLIFYEPLQEDKKITILMKLTKDDETKDYLIDTTIKSDVDAYNEIQFEQAFEDVFSKIDYYIPAIATSNVSLPKQSLIRFNTDYEIDCTEIVRNQIVYTFPQSNSDCTITASVTISDQTRSKDFDFQMSAIEELPKIPEIYISTDGNEEIPGDKEYVHGSITINRNGQNFYKQLTDVPISIRLRGNSTIGMPKKAYKIKFDTKDKLLSFNSESDWVLLANFVDQTLVRNYLAFSMAYKLDMGFTPKFTFVDVYLNGEYQGNYLLTDQIEVTNDRVDIEENVAAIDTGYLVELDIGLYREGLENTDDNYFLIEGVPYVLHSPEYDDPHYMDEQKEFIEDYFIDVLDTLKNKEDYSQLIDEASFIDWFIVNEVFKNVDVGYSSVYFYKDKGGLLKMGPVWDFDISSGVPGYIEERGPEGWYTPLEYKNFFFYYLMQYPQFRDHLKERWNEVYHDSVITVLNEIHPVVNSITYSRYKNFQKWDIIGKDFNWYTAPEIFDLKTYDEQVWFLYDYLETRIAWLDDAINDLD